MEIGDIYQVEIPPSNGHEQAGTRPAIIVQATGFSERLPTVLIVPLTSKLAAQGFPATFLVQPDAENRLSLPSVVLAFQLRAIDKRRLRQKIGRLSAAHLQELRRHIRALLQMPD